MENRSRGTQLSIIFLALGAALLLAPPADAFHRRLRTGRGIAHHQRCPNCPPDCPENLGGLLPMPDGKYPPVGKSAHYHPPAQPHYYGNQPSYGIQAIFEGQQPQYNGPPVNYDGPPPPYDAPPPPPPPSFNGQPPPPPPYNAPPPPYNTLLPPPPYNGQPPRDAPPPPSIYVPPLYNQPHAPFHQVVYDSPPPYNSLSVHHRAPPPPPSYEQPPAQDNSQASIQLIYESPEQKNITLPLLSLDPKDIVLKSPSNDSTTSSPVESTDPSLNSQDSSSSDSVASLSLNPSDSSSNTALESDQIPNESVNILPFNLPPYTSYNSQPPRTYQATMAYDQNPPWPDFRPEYRPVSSNYDRPSSPSLFNRIPRNFEYEPYTAPEYRPRVYFESDAGGFDFDHGKRFRDVNEFEEDLNGATFNEFHRRSYEHEEPRIDHRYLFPGDENPYKPYRPYKRHDNYVQNHYNLEQNEQRQERQPYALYGDGAMSEQPPANGIEISDARLESMIKQAIDAVRQEEAEKLAWPEQRYRYESPYAAERPAFVTMQQPKRYQLEAYRADEPGRPEETRETEWTPVETTLGRELDLGDANAEERRPQADLLDDMEQPPPTVTEPTIVDLLDTTSMPR